MILPGTDVSHVLDQISILATHENARHPSRERNSVRETLAHSIALPSRYFSARPSIGVIPVDACAIQEASGIDRKHADHASIEKSNTLSVPNLCSSVGMQSFSGIDTVPIPESARPICDGYSQIQCKSRSAKKLLKGETYGKREAALLERGIRHEDETAVEGGTCKA